MQYAKALWLLWKVIKTLNTKKNYSIKKVKNKKELISIIKGHHNCFRFKPS